MKRLFTLVILGCLATAAFASSTKVKKHPGTGIREQYMVILQDGIESQDVERVVLSIADLYKVRPLTVWKYAPHGFLCVGREKDIDDMARDERVKFVEQDHMMHSLPELSGTQWTWWNGEYLWHLDRIDELSYANRDSLHNMCTEGRNVAAYVIDSGVDPDHPQFEVPTRVREQFDFSPNRVTNPQDPNYISSETSRDVTNACTTGYTEDQLPAYRLRWHGTAVGSVLAGTQVGVAKPVVVSLKVQDCLDGRILAGDVVDAINFIGGPNNPYFLGGPKATEWKNTF